MAHSVPCHYLGYTQRLGNHTEPNQLHKGKKLSIQPSNLLLLRNWEGVQCAFEATKKQRSLDL